MASTPQQRIIYSMMQVGLGPADNNLTEIHGVRSAGSNVNLNIQKIYELGQLGEYDSFENVPEIELTLEKQLDGNVLLWHGATQGAADGTLAARGVQSCSAAMSIFKENLGEATGTPLCEVLYHKAIPTSVSYSIGTEGPATESLTLSALERVWTDVEGGGTSVFAGRFTTGLDKPLVATMRSGNVVWNVPTGSTAADDENGMVGSNCTVLPSDIYGVTAKGLNPADPVISDARVVPVQSIQVSANLGRDALRQLGSNYPYARALTYPIDVSIEIEVLARKMDNISVKVAGGTNGAPAGSNSRYQTFRLVLTDGTRIDCGTRVKLSTVNWSGGDAGSGGGGNVTNRYSYTTSNVLTVYHPADPAAFPAPTP